MNTTYKIAIDPGLSGGITAGVDSRSPHKVWAMPETESDVVKILMECVESARELGLLPEAYIEKLPAAISRPGLRINASSMGKLHRNCGIITGALLAWRIRLVEVSPQKWQKHYELGTRSACKSDTEWKNRLKSRAQKSFPSAKVTHATADSLLIYEWSFTHLGEAAS